MKRDGKGLITSEYYTIFMDNPAAERCECAPLSSLHGAPAADQGDERELIPVTPTTPELQRYLRAKLVEFFPRATPFSLLIIHVSQLEHIHIMPKTAILQKRQRYHAPASFLEQVLISTRRTLRSDDQVILHEGAGAAIILPDVDEEGAFNIVERVYHSINLLQPETVIPPLKRETDISIGIGSYPRPGASLEELLYHAGCVTHNLTLRPAITVNTQLRGGKAHPAETTSAPAFDDESANAPANGIPYMQLPARLPQGLKRLVPYQLACELRCAPVGRDHNRLTIAMAHPTDTHAIQLLQSATNMVIFPVACATSALDAMLAKAW